MDIYCLAPAMYGLAGLSPIAMEQQMLLRLGRSGAAFENTAANGAANTGGAANSVNSTRLSMQLSAEEAAGVRMPSEITGYTNHGLNQVISRDGVGVSPSAILDAWNNPIKIQYVLTEYGPTFKVIGRDATVVVNPQGQIITAWANGLRGRR